jgi:hypothetical protein
MVVCVSSMVYGTCEVGCLADCICISVCMVAFVYVYQLDLWTCIIVLAVYLCVIV